MNFEYKNRMMQLDDFNRRYKIISMENNQVLEESPEKHWFRDMDCYMEYVLDINYFSNVYYNITKRCNLKCIYCYSEHSSEYITLEQNENILNKLEKMNVHSITLIGGEPFCHPDFYTLLERVKSRKWIEEICIVTNGTLIEKTKLDCFQDKRIYLQISVDGIDEESNALTRGTGVYKKVFENLQILKNCGIPFKVMKVITRENVDNSKLYYEYYKKMGMEAGFFMVKKVPEDCKPTNKQMEALLNYIYLAEDKNINSVFDIVKFADNMMFNKSGFPITHCGAGITAISINPNGEVFPCVKKIDKERLITNIFYDNAIKDIQEKRLHIIKNELAVNKKYCKNCDMRNFCGGGCRAEEKKGNPCDYNCNYFKLAIKFYCEKMCEGTM